MSNYKIEVISTMRIGRNDKRPFMDFVEKTESCWIWRGTVRTNGYGSYHGTHAHVKSYEIHKGEIPENTVVHHVCGNRRCVNPEHLEAVSNRENVLEGKSLFASRAKQTHCKRGHELSGDNLIIRHKGNYTQRQCRRCTNFIRNLNRHH